MLLDYYNSEAAAADARRERALAAAQAQERAALTRAWTKQYHARRRAQNVWRRWQSQFYRYRHPAVPPEHSIAFITFWGGVVVVVFVFIVMMIATNFASLSRWIGQWF